MEGRIYGHLQHEKFENDNIKKIKIIINVYSRRHFRFTLCLQTAAVTTGTENQKFLNLVVAAINMTLALLFTEAQ